MLSSSLTRLTNLIGAPAAMFTTLDWIGTGLAALTTPALAWSAFYAHAIRAMYADFGATELPILTRLATSLWFPLLFIPVVGLALAFGIREEGTIGKRRAFVVAAFFVGVAALVICYVGAYLPIWSLAGAIRAD